MSDRFAESAFEAHEDRARSGIPFEIGIALLLLVLSLLYALLFSRMVYDSLVEHFTPSHIHALRFAGPPHAHNAIEWALLVGPALIGWVGVVLTLRYLGRRSLARRPDTAKRLD
ncbi:MAG: hypothetical protein H0V51_03830 [Chloroflexi bacterium]|nr:hypothetical protein [Chloroflexota bacterium]